MFKRGFKTWCENVAVLQRKALGLEPTDPLSPSLLANHIGVEVWKPEEIPGIDAGCLRVLLHEDSSSWSAVTLSVNSRDVIIVNTAHRGGRPASNLMHELAHILIGHSPARVDVSEDGYLMLNTFDRSQEDEANWLCGCLLLPREALLSIQRRGIDLNVAKTQYGVSLDMMKYRLQVTGIAKLK